MFLALGAGAYSGGLFHLAMHAYLKSMLFLCSGIVIHSLLEQQDIRFMGGLRKHLPLTAICYLIGCISISGLMFGGFFSKEMILGSLIDHKNYIYALGFLLASFMTVFYMFRSYFIVFEGEFRGQTVPHKPSFVLIRFIILFNNTYIFSKHLTRSNNMFLYFFSYLSIDTIKFSTSIV